ncbi:hypothetical protein ACLBOM_37150 [Escherichia coli]
MPVFWESWGEEADPAWSVAMVLGVEDKVEPLLFDAVQKTRRLKSAEEIPGFLSVRVFIRENICRRLPVRKWLR